MNIERSAVRVYKRRFSTENMCLYKKTHKTFYVIIGKKVGEISRGNIRMYYVHSDDSYVCVCVCVCDG